MSGVSWRSILVLYADGSYAIWITPFLLRYTMKIMPCESAHISANFRYCIGDETLLSSERELNSEGIGDLSDTGIELETRGLLGCMTATYCPPSSGRRCTTCSGL